MKNVIIFSSNEDWVVPLAAAPGTFVIQVTSELTFSGTADCALISQQHAGNQLRSIIDQLKVFRIPCAVVTYDGTLENQEQLLQCGADDVIVLPIAAALLRNRIQLLSEATVRSDEEMNFAAFDRIIESKQGNGSFIVAENDFMNIYRFVTRILERLDHQAQLILFSFKSDLGPFIESDGVLKFLKIVQTSLRRGDISSVYGKQVLVILMGANEEDAQHVSQRVIGAFNAHYNMDESCNVSYEIREIRRSEP